MTTQTTPHPGTQDSPAHDRPKLDAPGAGLPPLELFISRILFRYRLWTGSRESFTADFQEERSRIRNLIQPLSPSDGGRRVLILRHRGLEDSSRHWSVWMTLEHLRIVHGGFVRVVTALGRGHTPPGAASTAAVKPGAEVDGSVVAPYEASCDAVLATVAAIENLKTEVTYTHPWFGALDGFGWVALSGRHLQVHRIQIERILQESVNPSAAR